MPYYCLKSRKYTETKNPKVAQTNSTNKTKCAVPDSKKMIFIKKQDNSGLLSSLVLKLPLGKTSVFVLTSFC